MSLHYEPDATATALAEARDELKRVMPVYRAAMRWFTYYGRKEENWGDGFPMDAALARYCARAERKKWKFQKKAEPVVRGRG